MFFCQKCQKLRWRFPLKPLILTGALALGLLIVHEVVLVDLCNRPMHKFPFTTLKAPVSSIVNRTKKKTVGLYLMLLLQDQNVRTTNIDGGEILDEIITRSRGEIRHSHSPKVNSATPSSFEDIKPAFSPRLRPRAFSPCLNELRMDGSPRSTGKKVQEKQTPSPGPSGLGRNPYSSPSG